MPSPVTLTGIFVAPATSSFTSTEFNLQSGSIYQVDISCQPCYAGKGTIFLSPQGSNNLLNYTLYFDASGDGYGTLSVSNSGAYSVFIYNSDPAPRTLSVLSITASVPETIDVTSSITSFSITSATQYSQMAVPLYTVLGIGTSALILVVLVVLVVLCVLLEQGIISVSTKRRQRRKRRR